MGAEEGRRIGKYNEGVMIEGILGGGGGGDEQGDGEGRGEECD